ncbi:MAG: diguanylate cyclase [Victivallales bacterium]|nr:diguanylate cyclase [Victivallales bacterium]
MEEEKILIVEDSRTQSILLKEMLLNEGYSVEAAEDGVKALEFINDKNYKPDIVMTDINMPEMDGLKLCRILKRLYPEIFVIVLSANEHIGSLKKSFESGAIDFISKPINKVELIVRTRNVLRIRRAEKELKFALKQLSEKNKKLDKISVTDALTGLANRKHLIDELDTLIGFNNKYGYELALTMIDLDDFKKINDIYGHDAGDEALVKFAEVLKNKTRDRDLAGRYGGEEFILILSNTSLLDCFSVIEKILNEVRKLNFDFDVNYQLTFSAGIAKLNGQNLDALIKKADELMYKAKKSGKNRIET